MYSKLREREREARKTIDYQSQSAPLDTISIERTMKRTRTRIRTRTYSTLIMAYLYNFFKLTIIFS